MCHICGGISTHFTRVAFAKRGLVYLGTHALLENLRMTISHIPQDSVLACRAAFLVLIPTLDGTCVEKLSKFDAPPVQTMSTTGMQYNST